MRATRIAYLIIFILLLGAIFVFEVRLPPGFPFGNKTTTTTGPHESCTAGWNVTGYFTPIETDYSGATQTVTVNGTIRTFYSTFLTDVQVEGYGKTRVGDYISYLNGVYIASNIASNSLDSALKVGDVAVDFSVIQAGTNVTIPTLPSPWDTTKFIADDSGAGIVGRHVDVYTGMGLAAGQEDLRITGSNQTVCQFLGAALAAPSPTSLVIAPAGNKSQPNLRFALT